jgi:polyisoprenoid-binding protein YceI
MKYFLLLISFLSLSFAGTHEMKLKSGQVSFKIKNAGMTVDGTFGKLEADIHFDPMKPQESSIRATVNSATINTGNNTRDGHLKKALYFDAEKYPKITLQSTKIEKTGPISYTGTFKLTIKAVTRELKIPFLYMKTAEKAEFKGSFTINRLDYNVGEDSFTLSDNVVVSLQAEILE